MQHTEGLYHSRTNKQEIAVSLHLLFLLATRGEGVNMCLTDLMLWQEMSGFAFLWL